jgi:hypothetical protein
MDHVTITIRYMDGKRQNLVIDRLRGDEVEDGVVRFYRTESRGRRTKLLSVPLIQIRNWG